MDRRTYTFKIGQSVYYGVKGWRSRTGAYFVVGLLRHPNGTILYRIRRGSEEHLANGDELKLALGQPLADE
jgi:hypothetical protein